MRTNREDNPAAYEGLVGAIQKAAINKCKQNVIFATSPAPIKPIRAASRLVRWPALSRASDTTPGSPKWLPTDLFLHLPIFFARIEGTGSRGSRKTNPPGHAKQSDIHGKFRPPTLSDNTNAPPFHGEVESRIPFGAPVKLKKRRGFPCHRALLAEIILKARH